MRIDLLSVCVLLLIPPGVAAGDRESPRKGIETQSVLSAGPVRAVQAPQAPSRSPVRGANCAQSGPTITVDRLESIRTSAGFAGYVIDVPGYYVLTGSLSLPDLDVGILITSDDVTLDLGGHTIRDPRGVATIVRSMAAGNICIRSGVLEGGAEGIRLEGPVGFFSRKGATVERMTIRGLPSAPLDTAILIDDLPSGRVLHNVISNTRKGLVVTGWYGDFRILGNRIDTSQIGIDSVRLSRCEISSNHVIAPQALSAGDTCLIHGNTLISTTPAPAGVDAYALKLESRNIVTNNSMSGGTADTLRAENGNVIADNRIDADTDTVCAVLLTDQANALQRNRLTGGRTGVCLRGRYNRIVHNEISSRSAAIEVDGGFNLIEGNRIHGNRLPCGITFHAAGNVYRDNIFQNVRSMICGTPHTDGGGNDENNAACRTGNCAHRRVVYSDQTPGHAPGASVASPGVCEKGAWRIISEWKPTEVQRSRVGLLIDEPGCYLLTRDLDSMDLDTGDLGLSAGVRITAPDVLLDLGGYGIRESYYDTVALQVIGAQRVTLRNGWLFGGEDGVTVEGDPGTESHLTLTGVMIGAGGNCATGLFVGGIDRLEIDRSIVSSDYRSARISGPTTGFIVNSIFTAGDGGLVLRGFHDGVIAGIYSTGGFDGGEALGLHRGGRNVIAENILVGRSGVSLEIFSDENLILDNLVQGDSDYPGISAGGTGNFLDGNMVVGVECGLSFVGHDNTYARSVVLDTRMGVCGLPAEDRGGNILTP